MNMFKRIRKNSSAQFLISFLENIPSAFAIVQEDGRMYLNQSFSKLLNYSNGDLSDIRWDYLLHHDDVEKSDNAFKQLHKGQTGSVNLEKKYLTKHGTIKILSENIGIHEDTNGQKYYLIAASEIVMERDNAFRTKESFYKDYFKNNPYPCWIYELGNWRFLEVNDAAVELFGYSAEEFSKMTIKDIRPAEDIPVLLENLKKFNKAEPIGKPCRYKTKSGNIIESFLSSHDMKIYGKHVRSVLLFNRKDELLYHNPNKSITGQQALSFGIGNIATWEIDITSGKFLYDERKDGIFENIFNSYSTLDDFINQLHPDDSMRMKYLIDEVKLARQEKFEIEYRVITKSGNYKWFRDVGGVVVHTNGDRLIRLMGITENINERIESNNARLSDQYELNFRTIFYNSTDILVLADVNGIIKSINRAPEGYTYDDLIGKSYADFLNESQQQKFLKAVDVAVNTKTQTSMEVRVESPDGREVDWHVKILATHNYDKPIGLVLMCTDVTEIKKSADYVKESEERFRKFFEFGLTGNFISTIDGKLLTANQRFKEIFGFSSIEEMRRTNTKYLYANQNDRKVLMERVIKDKQVQDYELEMVRKDGKKITILTSIIGQFDELDKLVRLVGYVRDITERKLALNKVKQLSSAVEQSPASVVITDIEGNIQYVNPKCLELTGYSLDEVIGKNPKVFKSGETTGNEYNILWKTITSGGTWRGEFRNKKKNGELYWEYAIISPILDQNGKITNFLAVKEDINDRKKMMQELIKAKDKAEEINRIKSNFFSNMSHELRTPLTGILGYTELFLDDVQNEEQERMLDSIHQSGERLLDTLNKILHISKIESETLIPKLERVYLPNKIKNVVNELNAAAIKKGLFIKVNFEYDNLYANLDREMLRIILSNLVMNAIKFTKVGGINISCRSTFVEERHRVFVCVEDTGIGIHPSDQSTIFEEFRQASEGLSRNYEGTGLGLTIVKKYTELLGGKITVQSELEKGTKFTLEFPGAFKANDANINPNKSAVKSVVENVTPAAGEKPVLLLVEDDPITSEVMAKQLQEEFIINTSNCGEHALESISLKKYDAILMDISLGKGMNGLETTKNIRLVPGYETIPIAAVTAFAMNGEKEKFISAGLTDYISKPFTKVEFIKFVRKILDKHKK